ncbi:hypothetical protein ABT173_00110 [Streptomyces sp. NPDC001795]|uniref:hypothetical protein n=1 Tax=unclassified Streptomyces TaxID=2593676 RepID=UPI00332AA1D2
MGVVTLVAALPIAVASAGPVGDADRAALRMSADDDANRSVSSGFTLGVGLATAARCGPQLSSLDGIEAQTCVLTQGRETWARTYYRNATGEKLSSVLSFMGPDGRSVEMDCAVSAADDPETCETPRQRVAGDPGAYSAVAEFAGGDGSGPLLLRSGSDASESG